MYRHLIPILVCVSLLTCVACTKHYPQGATDPGSCSAQKELAAWLNVTPGAEGVDSIDGLPTGIGDADDCAFNKFAWQDFLALVRPQPENPERAWFERWEEKWEMLGLSNSVVDHSSVFEEAESLGALALVEYVEAGPTANPLVDVNGSWTYFGQRVNAVEAYFSRNCGLTVADCYRALSYREPDTDPVLPVHFPNQSVELKESWKILSAAEIEGGTFYTRLAVVSPARVGALDSSLPGSWAAMDRVAVGLVGFHILHLVPTPGSSSPDSRSWVWATFEHEDNAPSCDAAEDMVLNPDQYPSAEFSYFDVNCIEKCEDRKSRQLYNEDIECKKICTEFNVNHNNGCEVDAKPLETETPAFGTVSTFACGPGFDSTCNTSAGCFKAVGDNLKYYGGYKGGRNCFRADLCKSAQGWVDERNSSAKCASTVPVQLCRVWPIGFRGEKDGDRRLDPTISELNQEIRAALVNRGPSWAAWSHYQLAGVQWGVPHDEFPIPIASSQLTLKGDPMLVNVTLEPFIQGGGLVERGSHSASKQQVIEKLSGEDFAGGCLGCHGSGTPQFGWRQYLGVNFIPWREVHFSHTLDYLSAPTYEKDGPAGYCERMVPGMGEMSVVDVGAGDLQLCAEAVESAKPETTWQSKVLETCPYR